MPLMLERAREMNRGLIHDRTVFDQSKCRANMRAVTIVALQLTQHSASAH